MKEVFDAFNFSQEDRDRWKAASDITYITDFKTIDETAFAEHVTRKLEDIKNSLEKMLSNQDEIMKMLTGVCDVQAEKTDDIFPHPLEEE